MSLSWQALATGSVPPLLRRSLVAVLALATVGACAWLGYTVGQKQGIAAARIDADHRLDLFASAVQGVVRRLEPVPATIQLNPDVLALLRAPKRAARVREVSDYLRRLNAHVGSIAAFVLDERGVVLASSNAERGDDSSVGEDISFRPYYLEALSGRVGRHFAIGKGHRPGYFVSHPIHDGSRVVGVAAIKIGLDPIDQTWQMLGAPGLLADTNQVVILASNPAWRYKALSDMPLERRVELQLTRMYNNLRIQPFPFNFDLPADENFSLLKRSMTHQGSAQSGVVTAGPGAGTMLLVRTLDGMDWRVVLFSDLAPVRRGALTAALLAGLGSGFVVLLALHLAQRRRILRHRIEAEHLLERVNAELELKVAERTADLTAANMRLRTEVAEREHAEGTLRSTQDELMHAAKMALLGRLATSITHELTQPLGAIRTLSGNAMEFQRRGDGAAAAGNLQIIARLADQMGNLIQPLKSFARKSVPIAARVDIAVAVANALFLLDPVLRRENIALDDRSGVGRLAVWCDANRLEQVLVNLIGNAIDAMHGAPVRRLTLRANRSGAGPGMLAAADGEAVPPACPPALAWVCIDVIDSGSGLDETVRARLFEPFFTSKPSGAGLGLGLVISRDIVREFGGEIDATPLPEGGSCFSVRLPVAPAAPMPTNTLGTLNVSEPPQETHDV